MLKFQTLIALVSLAGHIVLFFFAWRTHHLYRKYRSPLVKYFRNMAFFAALGLTILLMIIILFLNGIITLENEGLLWALQITGGTFIFISFAFGIASFFYIAFPNISSDKVFLIAVLLVCSVLLYRIFFLPMPRPWADEGMIVHFEVPLCMEIFSVVLSAFGLLPLALVCILEDIREKKKIRLRSILMGLCLVGMLVATVVSNKKFNPSSLSQYELGSIARIFSFVFLGSALLSISEEKRAGDRGLEKKGG